MEPRRGFGIVGQWEFIDQRRKAQDQSQIERHSRLPGRIDRKPEGFRTGGDEKINRIKCGRRRVYPFRLALYGLCGAVLPALRLRFVGGFAFHGAIGGRGEGSSAKWQATARSPNFRSAGIVVLHWTVPRGQRP